MLFEFVKYIQPLWYFNQKPLGDIPYWLDYRKLPEDYHDMIDIGCDYKNEDSVVADAALQLLYNGAIMRDNQYAINPQKVINNVDDNYLFVIRFFSQRWLLYILFIRILSFKNPFTELRGFVNAFRKKTLLFDNLCLVNKSFKQFESGLLKRKPLVSVIIPTLNRYEYLNNVLNDLEKQEYDNFEVIVCDQSSPIDREFYKGRNLRLNIIEQQEKALWLARNRSIRAANGEYIALSDDDMRISPDWLVQHLKCIDYFKSDISAGTFVPENVNCEQINDSFCWASHFSTNNVLLKKDVFQKVGLFDRQFEKQRMGDGEFGMRCYLNGIASVSNPAAISIDVKAPVGGLRQMGSWDSIRPTKVFAPRPVPSVLYFARRYFGNKSAWLLLLKVFPKIVIPYRYRNNRRLYPLGLVFGVFLFPVIIIQMYISWNRSSEMVKNGSRIEPL